MQEVRFLKLNVDKKYVTVGDKIKISASAASITKEPKNERLAFRIKGGRLKT